MIFRLTFILFFSLVFSFSFALKASAITIFSPVVELETEPGQTQEGVVKVYNETLETVFLEASIEGFVTDNLSGTPTYLPPEQAGDHLNWFNLSQSEITLNTEQLAIVPFAINVPASTVPGGYYAVIFWQSAPSATQGNQVAAGGRVGTLIFIKVKGDLIEEGEIENFQVKPSSTLYQAPVSFSFDFVNSGNIHLIPQGSLEITNIFGMTNVLPVNQAKRFVLPESSRAIETLWGSSGSTSVVSKFFDQLSFEINNLTIGRHKAVLKMEYGDGQSVSKEISFWFWPVRTGALALATILILIFFIRINSRVKKLKKALLKNEEKQNQQ